MTGERGVVRIPRFVRRSHPATWWRRLTVLAISVAGLVVFLPATNDSLDADIANLHFGEGVVIWAFAAMIPFWAAPEAGLPQMLRYRSLHRRVAWRLSVLVLFASSWGLLGNAYWTWRAGRTDYLHHSGLIDTYDGHAHACAIAGLWVLCLSPLPVLLDPLVWRLVMPETLRRGLRCARVARAMASRTRGAPPGFDPDRGAAGRPSGASRQDPARPPDPGPRTVSLTGNAWRHGARPKVELCWDGTELTLLRGPKRPDSTSHVSKAADAKARGPKAPPVVIPLARGGWTARAGSDAGTVRGGGDQGRGGRGRGSRIRRPVAEIVWYVERHNTVRAAPAQWSTRDVSLVLLDERGFTVGSVRRVRDDWSVIASVVRAAGVAFTAYDLGSSPRDDEPRLGPLLFPRRGRQVRLFAN